MYLKYSACTLGCILPLHQHSLLFPWSGWKTGTDTPKTVSKTGRYCFWANFSCMLCVMPVWYFLCPRELVTTQESNVAIIFTARLCVWSCSSSQTGMSSELQNAEILNHNYSHFSVVLILSRPFIVDSMTLEACDIVVSFFCSALCATWITLKTW